MKLPLAMLQPYGCAARLRRSREAEARGVSIAILIAMPDQSSFFEHAALEADMQALALEVERHRKSPENKAAGGEELINKAIKSLPQVGVNVSMPQTRKSPTRSPLPAYAQDAPAEVRLEIEYLLDLAFHQGIAKAASEARKSPEFVQDTFRDALAGRLYPELKKRGIVK